MSLLKSLFPAREHQAQTTHTVLSKIISIMAEGVIVTGEDTRILASNQVARDAFARAGGDLENKRLSEVVRDLKLHEAFRQAIEENKLSDVGLELPGTEKRKFHVRIAPLELEGQPGAVGVFYDVTQIERLERVRQEFLSNISHELRTPLTSILAFVETLQDGAIDDEENNLRFLGVIRRNAERMHRLIDDILELSSIESGRITINRDSCDLSALVDEVYTTLSSKAEERGITLINDVPKGTLVYADAVRLEQILTNLIDNAVKFNHDEGIVTVSQTENRARNLISVSDTGEGISSEHLERIFERFYRTDRARSREIGGTGLGLAIVKHLVKLHGGEVFVNSTPGRGSVFSIELPREPA